MSERDEVRALVEAYARHVDDGDADAFAALFLPKARLRVWPVGCDAPRPAYEGAAAIAAIPGILAERYDRTEHRVGASAWSAAGDGCVTGTTACEAHHVDRGVDRVDSIRYEDTFGRDGSGRWRFAAREVRLVASEERPT